MLQPYTVRPIVASLLTAFALFGCQDNSSSSTTQDSPLLTYTAIDGYLMQAKVYFDENVNGIAEEAEYQGLTNERGVFMGSATDAPVIIKIVAGLTTDSDYSGSLTESRELVAAPGITEISPFSTLAFLQGGSLSDIAHELGIDVDKVSGDFIAKGHEDAHLLARSLFQQFDNELIQTQSNITAIHNRAQVISQFIQSSVQSDFQGALCILMKIRIQCLEILMTLNKEGSRRGSLMRALKCNGSKLTIASTKSKAVLFIRVIRMFCQRIVLSLGIVLATTFLCCPHKAVKLSTSWISPTKMWISGRSMAVP